MPAAVLPQPAAAAEARAAQAQAEAQLGQAMERIRVLQEQRPGAALPAAGEDSVAQLEKQELQQRREQEQRRRRLARQAEVAGFVRDLHLAKPKAAAAQRYFAARGRAAQEAAFGRAVGLLEEATARAVGGGACGDRLWAGFASVAGVALAEWEELEAKGLGQREAQKCAAFFTHGGPD